MVPAFANGVFAVQVIGADAQPMLQIVPLLNGFSTSGGTLYLTGFGFVEAGTTIKFTGGEVVDSAANTGPDIYYQAAADNTGVSIAEPGHGLGPLSVTTAGGTSVSIDLNELRTTFGYLRDVAVDTTTGDVWVADNGSTGTVYRIDPATGAALGSFQLNSKDFGSNSFYGGIDIAQADFILGATDVPAGSLLLFNGAPNPDQVTAVDPATGAVIASLALSKNFDTTGGVFDAAGGSFWVIDRSVNPDRMIELSAVDGTEISAFNLPFNAGESGLAIDPVTGNIWYGSDQSGTLVELSRTGEVLRSVSLPLQGMNSNELTGLAFTAEGKLLASSTQGRVYLIDPAYEAATSRPVLTGIIGTANQGTAANAAQAAANAGQMIELTGANFGAGTRVLFQTRDNSGQIGIVAVAPLAVNGAGTRLQVLVPDLATTGDVRLTNAGTVNLGGSSAYVDAAYRQITLTFTADDAQTVLSFADGGIEAVSNESWGLDNVKVTQGGATVFADDFESGVADARWSDGRVETGSAGAVSLFSGRFASEEQRLTLGGLTAGQTYTLSFDLYALDSWDGESTNSGPDLFQVQADGQLLMRESIGNWAGVAQSINNSAGVRLQVVPTLTGTSGSPGADSSFTLYGSGFMEGASTVTIGGVALVDGFTNLSNLDVNGYNRNSDYNLYAPMVVEGPIRVTTEGGFAEIAAPTRGRAGNVELTGIIADAGSGTPAQLGAPSANIGQLITLTGSGFAYDTEIQFRAVDDTGVQGVVSRRPVSVNADGTQATVSVPALAASGLVSVRGSSASFSLQVVPLLRSVGGTVAPGNTLLIEGSGLVQSEVVVQVDGRAIGNFSLRTVTDPSSYGYDVQVQRNQQLLTVVLPSGVANPVITVSTAGGTATLRTAVEVTGSELPAGADAADTIAAAAAVNLGVAQSVVLNGEIGDGAFGGGDVDLHSVNLAQGDLLNILGHGAIDTYVRVFDSDGKQQFSRYFDNAGDVPGQFLATAGGTYYVGVSTSYNGNYDPLTENSGYTFGAKGTYQLELDRMAGSQSRLTTITATANRGTAAQSGVAAANVGQTITLHGSGFATGDSVVFTTVDSSGLLGTATVEPASLSDDRTSLTVVVPDAATTGMVRLVREQVGLLLQVVPTLSQVNTTEGQPFNNGAITLIGTGFAEGATSIGFGATTLKDGSRFDGVNVNNGYSPSYVANARVDTTVPNGVATGAIRVTTVGGTSDTLARSFTALTAAASSGTPADAGIASANPGQSVTVTGTGLTTTTGIVFETIDGNGTRGQTTVLPWQVNVAGTLAEVEVPRAATTGFVRVVGDVDASARRLQVVPVLEVVDVTGTPSGGAALQLTLSGAGFVEGSGSEYRFGDVTVFDGNASTGPDVYDWYYPYTGNGRVSLTLPYGPDVVGALTVRTEGGTSAPLSSLFTAITGTALSGTPADGGMASANPGQSITLTGSKLSVATDVLFSFTESGSGTVQHVLLNPVSAAADGTSASLVIPRQANGIATLRILGSNTQHTLQVVPLLSGYSVSGGNLYVTGAGFVEGATTFGFAGASVEDVATNAGPDIYYSTNADNTGAYFTDPVHGFGTISVTTAGGTSVSLAAGLLTPQLGYLRDIAVDSATGAVWIGDNANPASIHHIDTATGAVLESITFNSKDFGTTSFYGGLQVAPTGFTLNGTAVAAGALLAFNGATNADTVLAIDTASGSVLASLALAGNYDMTSGVFDPTTGRLFVIDRRQSQDVFVEIDPVDGTELGSFNAPFNAGESGLAIDPLTGNLWYGSDNTNQLVEMSRTGTVLRTLALGLQGVDGNVVSGLAFDDAGMLLVSSTNGRVFRIDTAAAPAMVKPTLGAIQGDALFGTAADGTKASANVGQILELVGTGFGAGTQVVFTARDDGGVTGLVTARPLLASADGTHLQVIVPDRAATGDVLVTNVPVTNLGFSGNPDAIYRQVTLDFTADDATTVLRFADGGIQALSDESWGIDNVRITAGKATVFEDNFEGPASKQWSDARVDSSNEGTFTRFSGRFASEEQLLTLGGLTGGQTYTLTFDLYALDSWDGEATSNGPDLFQVSADGVVLMRDSISNYSVDNRQTFNASAPVRLQVVPTLTSVDGRPGTDSTVNLRGSGFMEGASTITIGGIAFVDADTALSAFNVSGGRNDTYSLITPLTLDGKIRVTTDGGFAEIEGPTLPAASRVSFTGIQVPGLLGGTSAGAGVAVNAGQTITLLGQGFKSDTLVRFEAVDDTGQVGLITRGGTASSDGTTFTVHVPVMARSGAVQVLGASDSHDILVVPRLRAIGGTIAAGNTLILEGTGLVPGEVSVQIDGQAVAAAVTRTVVDSGAYQYYGSGSETGVQQLLTLTVPAGVGDGVITVTTAGGSAVVRQRTPTTLAGLTPADDVGDTLATSTAIALSQGESVTVAASVGDGTQAGKDVDLYRVDLAANEQLALTLAVDNYSFLRIFDDAGQQLASDFLSSGDTPPILFRPGAAGTYYVGVSGYTNATYDPATAGSGPASSYTGAYTMGVAIEGAGVTSLTGIVASADLGTPAQGGVASANPGQTITLQGSNLRASEVVVFTTINGNGFLTTQTVSAASVADDGSSLTVVVPDTAATGAVRLARDSAGLLLQVVPVLVDVSGNVGGAFAGGSVSLLGRGFTDGMQTIHFGTVTLSDLSRADANYVSNGTVEGVYVQNGRLQSQVPSGAESGPISVTTVGGTSNVLGLAFTAITAQAASGTPADAGQPSANPGQVITLEGTNFDASTDVVFETVNSYSGARGQVVVRPDTVSDDGTSLTVAVPDSAVTGFVRVFGDSNATEAFLQVVPVLDWADVLSASSDGVSVDVRLKGRGFIDGAGTNYVFGTTLVEDAGIGTGPDAYSGFPDYVENGTVDLRLVLGEGSFGPITVQTEGGTSAPWSVALAGITATAASGTPDDPGEASANAGDTITLTGSGLRAETDVLLRYRESGSGALRMVRLSLDTVADDGTSATMTVPVFANGAFTLQVLGSSSQKLLQIVPTVTGFDVSGGNLYLTGTGFLEGNSSFGLAGATLVDTVGNAGPDIYYATGGDNSGVVLAEPTHGFGPITVTTAGGTSAEFVLNEMTLPYGYLRDVAFDTASGALWVADNANPGKLHRVDTATGGELQVIDVTAADFGSTQFYGGLQIVTEAFSLNGTNVPVGSLLAFDGAPNADRVIALDPSAGTLIASLTLAGNYDLTSGIYDPGTNHLFVIDRRSGPHQIVEIDPADGTELANFNAPVNAGESGMAVDPVTGNLWYAADGTRTIYEITTAGVAVRNVDLTAQDVDQNEITGLAFDADGKLLVSSSQGRVYRVTV